MNLTDYRASALRFEWSEIRSVVDVRLQHGVIGLASELGELLEVSFAPEFDQGRFLDEAGDQLWYMNLIADALGDNLDTHIVIPRERPVMEEVLAEYALHVSRLSDVLKKALFYRDRAVCPTKVRLHLDGALSCLNTLVVSVGSSLQGVADQNIIKLEARHGAKAGA